MHYSFINPHDTAATLAAAKHFAALGMVAQPQTGKVAKYVYFYKVGDKSLHPDML
jgi:hypothetical protein